MQKIAEFRDAAYLILERFSDPLRILKKLLAKARLLANYARTSLHSILA